MKTADDLKPYQCRAIEFMLANPHAGLFLDMGLGKTVITLTALLEFKKHNLPPALIIGPIRVIETVWRQEAEKWGHLNGQLTFSLVRGTRAERKAAIARDADVYLADPHNLPWLFEELGDLTGKFGTLVIDESSQFKNISTKRFRTMRFKVGSFPRRYMLTGTPRPNSLLEIWPQIYMLDLGKRLGTSFVRFRERFFHTTDYLGYVWEPRPKADDYVHNLLSDVVLRMDAKDYMQLPAVVENYVHVTMPPAARKIYRDLEDKMIAEVNEDKVTAANAAVAIGKCRQVANGALYTGEGQDRTWRLLHDAKLDALEEVLDEINEPVIVVYEFKHDLQRLLERLKDRKPVVLGDSPDVVKTVADWNAKKIDVLLLHPASGGHGLNLQDGGHVFVFFSLTWSLEQYQQTVARLNRTGQTKPVIIHKLLVDNTVDELLDESLRSKAKGQAGLLDALRSYSHIRELS